MYLDYFGLAQKPFSITPDPRFLYMSPQHKEALAHLVYGIRENSGFVVVTGEVGTGKTTILNAFVAKVPARMPKVVIKNPNIRPENLYYLLGEAIGIPVEKRTRDFMGEYEERLKCLGGALLIVDEAQGLSVEMLEEIRLLSNLETPHEKLVQILLLGQQELNAKLQDPALRQLKQRIAIKFHIPPLTAAESREYIQHRLRVAGYEPRDKPLFNASAMGEIYRHTRGFPRMINIVCDNALLSGYTEDSRQITSRQVRTVVHDMEKTYGKQTGRERKRSKRWRLWGEGWLAWTGWTAAGVIAMVVLTWTVVSPGPETHESGKLQGAPPEMSGPQTLMQGENTASPEVPIEESVPQVADAAMARVQDAADERELSEGRTALQPSVPASLEQDEPQGMWVTVQPGDTVASLAADLYGRVSPSILASIDAANSEITDINLIYEGQQIFFPDITGGASVLFSVSVAAYHSIQEAQAVFSDLVRAGMEATIYPYQDKQGRRWFRVTIGTFPGRETAINYARKLKEEGFLYARPVKISMEE